MNIDAIFGMIFGVGGVGAITIIVTAYRRLKRGALDDDESIIKGLYEENKRLRGIAVESERREAEKDRQLEMEIVRRRAADEQAWVYKAHIIASGGKLPLTGQPPQHTGDEPNERSG